MTNLEVIIVDDCSTDSTPRVAAELEASDPRVRSMRLATNSGGCGAPRNMGIAEARGEFVLFLDSDDVITPDACQLLLDAAKTSRADFVAGALQRVHQHSGATEDWYQDLYQSERVYAAIAENPDLVNDTVATNKLYRVDFLEKAGLSFPTNMYYEDVVFTAQAMSAAQVIHYIPDQVYEWRVYDDETRTTITNQRTRPGNYIGRANAVRAARQTYSSQPISVRAAADVKALRHHLTLHLNDAPAMDDSALVAMLEAFAPVAATVLPQAVEALTPFERARFAAVVLKDPARLRASYADEAIGVLSGSFAGGEPSPSWILPGASVPRDSPAQLFLRFSGLSKGRTPPPELQAAAILSGAADTPPHLTLQGTVETRGGALPPDGFFVARTGNELAGETPLTFRKTGGETRWEARIQGFTPRGLRRGAPITVELTFENRDGLHSLGVYSALDQDLSVPDLSLAGRIFGDCWNVVRNRSGLVEFRLSPGLLRRAVHWLKRQLRSMRFKFTPGSPSA